MEKLIFFLSDHIVIISIIFFAIIIAVIIIIGIIDHVIWEKKIQSIKDEFGLIEGCSYDILQNGCRSINEIIFVKIYRGNRSKNGDINLLFIKNSPYRGETIKREVTVKYGSIWKVTKND